MKSRLPRLVASVLAIAMLALPAGLSAKEKRGADLVVTLIDDSQVRGELIAVRRDSILVLSAAGRDESLDLAVIKTIRVVRKAKAGKRTFAGFLVGAACGAGLGLALPEDNDVFTSRGQAAFFMGGFFGAVAAVSALAISALSGIDSTFPVAGEPYDVVWSRLCSLRARTREIILPGAKPESGVLPGPSARGVPAERIPAPVSAPAAPERLGRRSRFRITLPVTFGGTRDMIFEDPVKASFRLVGTAEDGPHPLSLVRYSSKGAEATAPDSISLAYELTGRWAAEIEVLFAGWHAGWWGHAPISFISAADGATYQTEYYATWQAKYSAILAGPTFRPFPPSVVRRHVFEAGLAAGPGWARFDDRSYDVFPAPRTRLILSARAHIAYVFYILPEFSVGATAGFRYLSARTAETVRTYDFFYSKAGDPAGTPVLEQETEVTILPTTMSASKPYFSLRIGVRF